VLKTAPLIVREETSDGKYEAAHSSIDDYFTGGVFIAQDGSKSPTALAV